jgi:hypothetical protein
MLDTGKMQDILNQLELKYTFRKLNDEIEEYEITVDAEEDLRLSALHYHAEEETYVRLYGYVDELDDENAMEQLSKLLSLNLDIPAGAYCLDTEEGIIMITINLPFESLTPDYLSWAIEFCITSQDIFYSEYYPEDPEEIAKG